MEIAFVAIVSTMDVMRSTLHETITGAESDELLTTGEAAKILNSSRQHVVDLCDRGDLSFTTTGRHRRVNRADLETLRTRTQRLTRDQLRSLWLSHAVAGALVQDPVAVLAVARLNLPRMREVSGRGQGARWLDEWQQVLDGPVEGVMEALTSRSPRSRELRQNSPFAGVLSAEDRLKVLEGYSKVPHAGSRS